MKDSSLVFLNTAWTLPLLAVGMICSLLVFYNYLKSTVPPRIKLAGIILKLLALWALVLCLMEPALAKKKSKPGANFLAVLADNSSGLQITDRGESKPRMEQLKGALARKPGDWQESLEDQFQVRRFTFDSAVNPAKDFSTLDFQGSSTRLFHALTEIQKKFKSQPLAGIVLLTDGIATDQMPAGELPGGIPVYTVPLGQVKGARDVAVDQLKTEDSPFEDGPITVSGKVHARGFPGETAVLEVRSMPLNQSSNLLDKPELLKTETLPLKNDLEDQSFRFQIPTFKPGISLIQARVRLSRPELEKEEATSVNNTAEAVVVRRSEPFRILYVSGRPNWEHKFLSRALSEDPLLEMPALIRIAKREPKFQFRGRSGESSNPLFRGFGDGEAERYDQPVLIRVNTRTVAELQGGFPSVAEDLYGYHALIIDDLEAAFFTHDQLLLIQKFVSQRGGGFLMLGGLDSFQHGGYAKTPIETILPVHLSRPQLSEVPDQKFELTREGWLQPWLRLRLNEADERARIEEMPPFQIFNWLPSTKPGALTLAGATGRDGSKLPAFLVQRFGHGKSAALAIGDVWRWGFQDEGKMADMNKAWRQMIRWLVTDVPERFTIRVSPPPAEISSQPGAVVLQAMAKDKTFADESEAEVLFRVRSGGSSRPFLELRPEPSLRELGTYESLFIPPSNGVYLVQAQLLGTNGSIVSYKETAFVTEFLSEEFRVLDPNHQLLSDISRRSGGSTVPVDDLKSWAAKLPSQKAPVQETVFIPLWSSPLWFLFVIICFCAVWGLRRLRGLP